MLTDDFGEWSELSVDDITGGELGERENEGRRRSRIEWLLGSCCDDGVIADADLKGFE